MSAARFYNHIEAVLATPHYSPRALFKRLNIAVIATNDAATNPLRYHLEIRDSGCDGRIVPAPCQSAQPPLTSARTARGWNGRYLPQPQSGSLLSLRGG
jgi:hypothetical protein